jgi:hypothetical protein
MKGWTRVSGSRIGSSGEFCKRGNEPLDSIKGNFLTSTVTTSFSRNTLHRGVS